MTEYKSERMLKQCFDKKYGFSGNQGMFLRNLLENVMKEIDNNNHYFIIEDSSVMNYKLMPHTEKIAEFQCSVFENSVGVNILNSTKFRKKDLENKIREVLEKWNKDDK
jgi:hypothetical protein